MCAGRTAIKCNCEFSCLRTSAGPYDFVPLKKLKIVAKCVKTFSSVAGSC